MKNLIKPRDFLIEKRRKKRVVKLKHPIVNNITDLDSCLRADGCLDNLLVND